MAPPLQRPDWQRLARFGVGHEVYRDRRINPQQWLYRYMSAETAILTLGKRRLWFADPKQWDDPHESWWCNQLFTERGHLPSNRAFGLCWTLRWRDEPIWRLHSNVGGAPAVRIRVRASVLTDWLLATVRDHATVSKAFLGKVNYCSIEQLIEVAKDLKKAQSKKVARVGAEALLMKRLAYEFEHEVRVLWLDRAELGAPKGLAFPFEPSELLDQVMIGPSKSVAAVDEAERKLIALRVDPRLICRSKVWATPEEQAAAERDAWGDNSLSPDR